MRPDLDQIISWELETAQRLCSQPAIAAQDVGIEEAALLVHTLPEETIFITRALRPSTGPPVGYGELKKMSPFTLLLYNHHDAAGGAAGWSPSQRGRSRALCPGNRGYWGSGAHAPTEYIRIDDSAAPVCFPVELFRSLRL